MVDLLTKFRDRALRSLQKTVEHQAGLAGGDAVVAHLRQPFGIVEHAVAQPRAEHVLQVGETLVAECAREAHQRGWLHRGAGRDARYRAEGDLVGVFQSIAGYLHQPLWQLVGALRDRRAQRLVVLGRAFLRRHEKFR
jgi:hypothetical protein